MRWLVVLLVLVSMAFSGCVADNQTAGLGPTDPPATGTTSPAPNETASPTASASPSPTATQTQSTSSPTATPEGETHTVEIGKTVKGPAADYAPKTITISVGDQIVWKNIDNTAPHSATANDGTFDTRTIGSGKSATAIQFDVAGTYTYYCAVHPETMKDARVVVED